MARSTTIRIVTADDLAENVPTPGMERREAVSGATRIIAVRTQPGLVSGWHHHGAYTTYGYVIAGRLRLESGSGGTPVVEDQVIVGFRVGSGVTVVNVERPDV